MGLWNYRTALESNNTLAMWRDYTKAKGWIASRLRLSLPVQFSDGQLSKIDIAVNWSWNVWNCPKRESHAGKGSNKDRWNERRQWFIACQKSLVMVRGEEREPQPHPAEQCHCCSLDYYSNHMWSACWCDVVLTFKLLHLTSQFVTTECSMDEIILNRCDCKANNCEVKAAMFAKCILR